MTDPGEIKTLFPSGHFYSPVVDPADIEARKEEIWPQAPDILGIDFNHASQLRFLTDAFPRWIADFDYAEPDAGQEPTPDRLFTLANDQFSNIDARALFVMLREATPRRVIEVGSGFSTLLMADTRRRFLPEMQVQCVEPYPRAFLKDPSVGIDLVESKVEHLPLSFFDSLQPGDILFIDSSHVSKTGSDVNYLFFEVVPRLPSGVLVHVHDIFLPNDYPYQWVVPDNRSWNEQYVLRAYLMFNPRARMVFGSSYVHTVLQREAQHAVGAGVPTFGGSLWFESV
jgi:hypothetical protein